jgi:hypothetical protein
MSKEWDRAHPECFALENLQPLWAKDNLAKHTKWEAAYPVADPLAP